LSKPKVVPPKPRKESVWDYPRPPRLEPVNKRLRVIFAGVTLADTSCGKRVLETSHPPVYYFPQDDIRMEHMLDATRLSFCEWKGQARYFDVVVNRKNAARAVWSYPKPTAAFIQIRNHIALYCQLMDSCLVGNEQACPQPGCFL